MIHDLLLAVHIVDGMNSRLLVLEAECCHHEICGSVNQMSVMACMWHKPCHDAAG